MAHIQMKTDLIKRIGIFCFRVQTHLREVNFFRYFAAVGTVNQNIRRTSELIQHLHTEIRKSFNFGIADFQNLVAGMESGHGGRRTGGRLGNNRRRLRAAYHEDRSVKQDREQKIGKWTCSNDGESLPYILGPEFTVFIFRFDRQTGRVSRIKHPDVSA